MLPGYRLVPEAVSQPHHHQREPIPLLPFIHARFNALTFKRQRELKCSLYLFTAVVLFGLQIAYVDDPYQDFLARTFPATHPELSRLLRFLPTIPVLILCFLGFRAVQVDVQQQQEAGRLASQVTWNAFSSGEMPMRTAFWRWHVPTCLLSASVVVIWMGDYLRQGTAKSYFFFAVLLAFGIVAQLCMLQGLWLCSRHYTGPRRWRVLTRASAMLLTVAVVALLVVQSYVAVAVPQAPRAPGSAPSSAA